MIRYDLDTL